MNKKHILHLYWRAGFGLLPKQLDNLSGKSKEEVVEELFLKSAKITPLHISTSSIDIFSKDALDESRDLRLEYNKLNASLMKNYSHRWMDRLVNTNETLREKMTLFWANHFSAKNGRIKYVKNFNNTLRKHALGDFRKFVKAISKDAVMIQFLNLHQNNKSKPNENFARELMELFTLGVGHYSELDVKECARAFSGYKNNFEGEFVFSTYQHDKGMKTFLGEKGAFEGDQIIDIILKQKQCARFICEKIYGYFVNENINNSHIHLMTEVFYKDYNIENLMRYVFKSDWFYNKENIGVKIKSPIELLVGMCRVIPLRFNKTEELIKIQTILNQRLLYPPDVAGWKGGKNWINTNSILVRVKLPSMILERESFTIQPKGNFTDQFKLVYVKNKYQEKLNVSVDWKTYKKQVKKIASNDLLFALVLCEINLGTQNYLKTLGKLTKKKNLAKIMSLPEYQMC
ncbi:DUF1800 domain-containing protein [Lacinutrix sp. C3R15]|uniref:DUF1800 domain-containing protein n=1 Tax=Flavobacteriaceae TaxID=49546 RepID=UPI001C08BAEC|nr:MULTISPECIES: DUF1800 domain-containing protein [Flavobacteriaceae]MBU2937920.1 DUF1800 domain-containing protein [Lacinutrix sp. C3R15]MDO6621234.1 DUF1800 domain-containing protein [Oceanihabitans sp. 1_MG-2023]